MRGWLIGRGGAFRDEQKKAKKRKKTAKAKLSFAVDEEEENGEESTGTPARDLEPSSKKKLRKNPNVDTSFLPDREREEAERKEREELRKEWLRKQEELKTEDIEITYSYWDGSGHRKTVTVSLICASGNDLRFLCRAVICICASFTLKTVQKG